MIDATKLKASDKVNMITNEIRASYVNVFHPKMEDDGNGGRINKGFSMQLLIPKTDTVTIDAVRACCVRAALDDRKLDPKKLPESFRIDPLRDGDEEKPGEEAYAGMMFMNASSAKIKPGICSVERDPMNPRQWRKLEEGEFQSGDWCKVELRAFTYKVKGNSGVSMGLNNIQKTRDGEPLGGGSTLEEAFGVPEDAPPLTDEDRPMWE